MDGYIFVKDHDPGQRVPASTLPRKSSGKGPGKGKYTSSSEKGSYPRSAYTAYPDGEDVDHGWATLEWTLAWWTSLEWGWILHWVFLVELKMNLKQLVRMTTISVMLMSTKQWHWTACWMSKMQMRRWEAGWWRNSTAIEQHQKLPWRDLVFGFMWGPPGESKTSTRESRAKGVRQGRAAKAAAKAGR